MESSRVVGILVDNIASLVELELLDTQQIYKSQPDVQFTWKDTNLMVDSGDRREMLLMLLLGVTTLGRGLLATGALLGPDTYKFASTPDRRDAVTYVPPSAADLLEMDAYELIRVCELLSDELT